MMTRAIAVIGLILAVGGCGPRMQIAWSGDGRHAAFGSGERTVILDADGNVAAELPAGTTAFAWSADGKSLYFVAPAADASLGEPKLIDSWVGKLPEDSTQGQNMAVFVLRDGKTTPLAAVGGLHVVDTQLSPDGQWLALMAASDPSGFGGTLLACHLPSRHVYVVAKRSPAWSFCFSGPSRLAYFGTGDMGETPFAALMETELADDPARPEQAVRAHVLATILTVVQARGDELFFSSVEWSFPSPADSTTPQGYALHRLSRTGQLTRLADKTTGSFALSPDGTRLLVERIVATEKPDEYRRELVLMPAIGGQPSILKSGDEYDLGRSMLWPLARMWRTNAELALLEPRRGEEMFEVVLYRITLENRLERVRVLSEKWADDLKPRAEEWPRRLQGAPGDR